jgi:DNA modification methylase
MIRAYFKDSAEMLEVDSGSVQLVISTLDSPSLILDVPAGLEDLTINGLRADIKEKYKTFRFFLMIGAKKLLEEYFSLGTAIERVLSPEGLFFLNIGYPAVSAEMDVFGTDLPVIFPYVVAEHIIFNTNLKLRHEYLSIFHFAEGTRHIETRIERWFMFSKTKRWKDNRNVQVPLVMEGHAQPVFWQWKQEGKKVRGLYTPFPEDILELLITKYSEEGDMLLDPYAGTGTLAIVGDRLHRNSILYEHAFNMQSLLLKRLINCKDVTFFGRASTVNYG